MGLQPRLLLVVLQEEGQVFGPAVFEASRQVHVDAVLREGSVEVRVEVPRVLCGQETRSDAPTPPKKHLLVAAAMQTLCSHLLVIRILREDPKL